MSLTEVQFVALKTNKRVSKYCNGFNFNFKIYSASLINFINALCSKAAFEDTYYIKCCMLPALYGVPPSYFYPPRQQLPYIHAFNINNYDNNKSFDCLFIIKTLMNKLLKVILFEAVLVWVTSKSFISYCFTYERLLNVRLFSRLYVILHYLNWKINIDASSTVIDYEWEGIDLLVGLF